VRQLVRRRDGHGPTLSSSWSKQQYTLLIRPDGYVAWAAAPDTPANDELRQALTTWFGTPDAG
jgi:hypothetical protein